MNTVHLRVPRLHSCALPLLCLLFVLLLRAPQLAEVVRVNRVLVELQKSHERGDVDPTSLWLEMQGSHVAHDPAVAWSAGLLAFNRGGDQQAAVTWWQNAPAYSAERLLGTKGALLHGRGYDLGTLVLQVDPSSGTAVRLVAEPFIEREQWSLLASELEAIIASAPANATAHALRGWVELRRAEGSTDAARHEIEQARALGENELEALRYILRTQGLLGAPDAEVEETLLLGLRMREKDFEFNFWYAGLFTRRGQLAEAAPYYAQALESSPNHPFLHARLGEYYHLLGQNDVAVQHYRTAIAIESGVSWFYSGLGDVLLDMGVMDKAVAAYCEAIGLDRSAEAAARLEALGATCATPLPSD